MNTAHKKIAKTFRLRGSLVRDAKRILGYKNMTLAIEDTLQSAINNKRHDDLLKSSAGRFKKFKSLYDR